jgi:protein-S-isoprenylcysteine O-methyltransferase Ste14
MNTIKKLIHTVLSVSGFVPEHTGIIRTFFMLGSVLFSVAVLPNYEQINFAVAYFAFSTIAYIGFISLVLPENGLKLKLIEKYGEEKAYEHYEGFLAFAFFHNGVSLTFISQSSSGSGFWGNVPTPVLMTIVVILFTVGAGIKIWSAWVVGVPIYYWKDLFVGRKICDFVITGPYKYLSNPMYGIGQLQVYAIAIYYNSIYGIIFGAVNQLLVFQFFFTVEKPFIHRTYIQPQEQVSLPVTESLVIPMHL